MKTCKKCRVNIIDDTNVCPLCKSIIHSENPNEKETGYYSYPKIIMSLNQYNLATRILVLISIVASIAVLVINTYTPGIPWSLICILGILYLWVVIPFSIKKNINIASKVVIHTIAALILAFVLNYILSTEHWYILDFSIPIIITISNIAMIILQIIQSIHHENYFVYQLMISLISFIPLILLHTNLLTILLPTYISFGAAGIALISTIIFYSKDFIAEIKKRFHF